MENDKGLSMDLIKILHRQLMEKAKTLLGREMIYELCQEVQEFLYINNKPPAKSFYEQHLENRLNLEKQQLEIVYDEKKKFQDQLVIRIFKYFLCYLFQKRLKGFDKFYFLNKSSVLNHV